jgi:hypothetical protein
MSPTKLSAEGFKEYIANKFQVTSSYKWDDVILFFEQDQCTAFDRAMELFREYLRHTNGVQSH